MGKRPKLDGLNYLFDQGVDFCVTEKEYEEKTGVPLPKNQSYLKTGSALAARAKEKGYVIIGVEEKPVIEKTVILKKEVGK